MARFVSVHGRRAAIFGYSQQGLEFWAYPFQIISGYKLSFRAAGATTSIDGDSLLRRIIYTPESVTRIYIGPDFTVREHIFVPLDETGAIINYEVASSRPIDIGVHFVPVLNLMWPGGIGGQETVWRESDSAYLISEPTHRFSGCIGSPDIVTHDDMPNQNRQLSSDGALRFTVRAGADHPLARVLIAGGVDMTAPEIVKDLHRDETSLLKIAADHYSSLLENILQIETPDQSVNRALAWSEIALDQAWVCNPDLGCGLVAGYGPSRKARRPQYDWFFAGDGMVSLRALLAEGDYSRAREELEFILKYQDTKTGMIWHELSQSAGWIEWGKYPYLFAHVNLTFDFLKVMDEYVAVTGDRVFAAGHWLAIESAYGYCRSLVDPSDGLPHIPIGKEGAREQDRLTEELALSADWVEAASAFSTLAKATGHGAEVADALGESQKARTAIPRRYWDQKQSFWISGFTRSGAPLADHQLGPLHILNGGIFSDTQRDSVLQQIASADFQADWGTRGRASTSSTYDPNSYANGSVWATGSAAAADAFWSAHSPATAFQIWNALVPWSSLDSLGHMPETLVGDYYREQIESVPEQTWSSATFLSAAVNGLLGLEFDARSNHLTFAPHLPPSWNEITLQHLRVRPSAIQIKLSTANSELRLEMQNTGTPLNFTFDPEIPLGARLGKVLFQGRTTGAVLEPHQQDSHAKVELNLPHGNSTLTIEYSGGVQIEPNAQPPELGDPSHQLKITQLNLQGATYTVHFDYVPAIGGTFKLYTPWHIEQIRGARLQQASPHEYKVVVASDPARTAYEHGDVQISFALGNSQRQIPSLGTRMFAAP